MKSLARYCVRHRWYVLFAWLALFILINVISQSVGSAYSNAFSLPGTNSTHAEALLAKGFPHQSGDIDEIVFQSIGGPVSSHQATIQEMLRKVEKLPDVGAVISPFCTGSFANGTTPSGGTCQGALVSSDGTIAYAVVKFAKTANHLTNAQIKSVITEASTIRSRSLGVQFGGNAFGQLNSTKGSPFEAFGLIATAIVLVLAFGSFFAMLLPLGVALFALGIALASGILLSHVLAIAQFAPILGSLIGLGVGIDYALFIVTRSRQELKRGASVEDAVTTALNTSGRAVLFAGSTVCIALLGMLILGLSFLNGVAVSASLTVLITMLASVSLLPSLLAFQKRHVLSRKERRVLDKDGPGPVVVSGPWQRWSQYVSRHPRVLTVAALAVIITFVIPFFSLHLGSSDQGSDPANSTTRQAYDLLAKGFGPGFNGPLTIVGALHNAGDTAAMQKLDASLNGKPGIAFVQPLTFNTSKSVGIINVIPTTSPQDAKTAALISTIRSTYIPAATAASHTAVYVGGITAIFVDFAAVLTSKLPLFVGVIVLLGCLLLMVAFRSVLVPVVAAVMNLLAVGASFGLVVAVC
ncbi:MAG: MMPL family transporter, partial [Acidimicrobiales bacterium]